MMTDLARNAHGRNSDTDTMGVTNHFLIQLRPTPQNKTTPGTIVWPRTCG